MLKLRGLSFDQRLLFAVACFSIWFFTLFFFTHGDHGLRAWISEWHHWDAEWYEKIWLYGYASDPRMLVFPPGYSYIIGSLSWIFGSTSLAAFSINILCLFIAGYFLSRFLAERYEVSFYLVLIFFYSLPLNYYAFCVYSDSVFLLLFALAVIGATDRSKDESRTQKLATAALLFFLPLIRLAAYPLAVWLLFRRWSAAVIFFTLGAWLFINYQITGDALHFIQAQSDFKMPEGGFLTGLNEVMRTVSSLPHFARGDSSGEHGEIYFWFQVGWLPLLSMVTLTLTALWYARRHEYLLATTIIVMLLFSRNQAFWRSVFRYDWPLMIFAAAPLLARINSNSKFFRLGQTLAFWGLVVLGFALQLIFAPRLHSGAWAF